MAVGEKYARLWSVSVLLPKAADSVRLCVKITFQAAAVVESKGGSR